MAQRRDQFLWIGLTVLVVASLWRTAAVERDKRRINQAYEQAKQSLTQMESELANARQTMDQQSGDLESLRGELQTAQAQLDQTVAELASLQREHAELQQANTTLLSQVETVRAEKAQLEAKLSSIKELTLAIRDLRHKIWKERWAAWQQQRRVARESEQQRLASGNRGYLVRDGVSTVHAGTKLRVQVLEPQSR